MVDVPFHKIPYGSLSGTPPSGLFAASYAARSVSSRHFPLGLTRATQPSFGPTVPQSDRFAGSFPSPIVTRAKASPTSAMLGGPRAPLPSSAANDARAPMRAMSKRALLRI